MQLLKELVDTIVAPATPLSRGALSVLRLSGPISCDIAAKIAPKFEKTPREMQLCPIFDAQGALLDQALVVFFPGPKSFTGEDVVEIQCHGNPLIVQKIQESCCQLGARPAEPGEFLHRAHHNKKYDLAQVEAIAALIEARTTQALQGSLQLARGGMGKQVLALDSQVTQIRILLESSIDFSEEPDIDEHFLQQAREALSALIIDTEKSLAQAERSLTLHTGLKVCLLGAPNAGKSSLINAFAGEELALVDAEAGTTRDLIRHQLGLGGIPLSLIDTAGLRHAENSVEKRGISKAKEEAHLAQIVIYLKPVDAEISTEHLEFLQTLPARKILLHNKIDLGEPSTSHAEAFEQEFAISLKTGCGWEQFNHGFKTWVLGEGSEEGFHVVSSRQLYVLKEFLEILLESRDTNKTAELMAEGLYQAQQILGRLTHERLTQDDLLGKIFSTFCIGK